MTRPKYQPQVTDSYTAMEQGFHFYGSEDTLAHFQSKQANDPLARHIVNHFVACLDLNECLSRIKTDKKAAVAVSRHHADNNDAIPRSLMYCFAKKDNIYTYSVSMLTKKQYHLLDKVNVLVRTISESGLLQKWEAESSERAEEETNDMGGGGEGHGDAIKLKIEHVQAGFLLLGIGCIASGIIFALEWAFYKSVLVMSNRNKNAV